jgi:hypothetical protein
MPGREAAFLAFSQVLCGVLPRRKVVAFCWSRRRSFSGLILPICENAVGLGKRGTLSPDARADGENLLCTALNLLMQFGCRGHLFVATNILWWRLFEPPRANTLPLSQAMQISAP